jgi:hypothetical protein
LDYEYLGTIETESDEMHRIEFGFQDPREENQNSPAIGVKL